MSAVNVRRREALNASACALTRRISGRSGCKRKFTEAANLSPAGGHKPAPVAGVPTLVRGHERGFQFHFGREFGEYLWECFLDAGTEFGIPIADAGGGIAPADLASSDHEHPSPEEHARADGRDDRRRADLRRAGRRDRREPDRFALGCNEARARMRQTATA